MKISKYLKMSSLLVLAGIAGCTKLTESYKTTIPASEAASVLTASLLLQRAYNDLPAPFVGQDEVFSLEENSTDESLVPTRGGDWDDNGVWRVIHNHTWNADHAQVLAVFNNLNALNFDATNVTQFTPTAEQAAEATVLRAIALYYLLDLYNQFPLRNAGDTLINAPHVYTGQAGIDFIIGELNKALPNLSPTNGPTKINVNATKALLMRCYLNRGVYANRAQPTFADADMQQVITLGNQIIASGAYSYMPNYFGNFNSTNSTSTEAIFLYPSSSGLTVNNPGMDARWMMGHHYNEYDAQAPNAGWNGFSTTSDFYQSFGTPTPTAANTGADTPIDTRLGQRTTSDVPCYTSSGIKPGFLVGQQYDQNHVALKDRKGNALAFDPIISPTMIESGTNLEVTGIRVDKYVPDFSSASGTYYSSNPGNSLMLIRYPEVVLNLAEALMREATPDNATALALVNGLRAARGAAPLASPLPINPTVPPPGGGGSVVDDPHCLLAERGRETYFESLRRTDLIRFGVFLTPWQYKPTDDPKYLLFPVPNQALGVNPNLTQNPGY
jgi:starch-binding outer membrane protein, SusD/RagB family